MEVKEPTLFEIERAERHEHPKRLYVKQRRFSIHYGAMYILITELASMGVGYHQRLKPFQLLTEEAEKGKGVSYNLRAKIIRRLEEKT